MLNLAYIAQLRDYLDKNPCLDYDARTKIIYPLLDEVFREGDRLNMRLQNGLNIEYLYKSNIAKELLLRDQEIPSHAWEPMTTRSLQLAIRHKPGSVLIGGAYFGDHALVAAHEISMANFPGLAICVEPNLEQRGMLEANAAANNLSQFIYTLDSILWDKSGLSFNLADSDSHACVYPDAQAQHKSVSIDEILQDLNIEDLSLMLLDIEGSEEKALRGAESALSASPNKAPIIIVEIHRHYVDWSNGLEATSIAGLLRSHGYSVFALRDCQSNWDLGLASPEIIPLDRVYLEGPPHGFNLIAAKDTSFFEEQGFRIVYDVSPKYLRHRNPSLHLPLPSV